MTYKKVNEQARRISGCSLTFYTDRSGAQIESRGGFVTTRSRGPQTTNPAFGKTASYWTMTSTAPFVIIRSQCAKVPSAL